MTAKRDLKRRVRERQARTGESYTTARRHVVAARAPTPAIAVDEAIDLTPLAAERGLRCSVVMMPALAARVEPEPVVTAVRDALVASERDPDAALLRSIALRGEVVRAPFQPPRDDSHRAFVERVRAGVGGLSADGRILALHVAGRDGVVPVLCAAWRGDPTLLLTTLDDASGALLSRLGGAAASRAGAARLWLVYEGRRHAITNRPFVIGRNRGCDLQIRDGLISRRHAAVFHRFGAFYLVDLGAVAGVVFRGLRIENKRIEEGDVFQLGPYAVAFTFRGLDA